jgi:hypothetical protein
MLVPYSRCIDRGSIPIKVAGESGTSHLIDAHSAQRTQKHHKNLENAHFEPFEPFGQDQG